MTRYRHASPVLVMPEREATLLWHLLNVEDRLGALLGSYAELDELLGDWRRIYSEVRSRPTCAPASDSDKRSQVEASSTPPRKHLLGSADVAAEVGLRSAAAVTLAAREGRLRGEQIEGRWRFTHEDVAAWNETRKQRWR